LSFYSTSKEDAFLFSTKGLMLAKLRAEHGLIAAAGINDELFFLSIGESYLSVTGFTPGVAMDSMSES